jgi:hypothetical protein
MRDGAPAYRLPNCVALSRNLLIANIDFPEYSIVGVNSGRYLK